MATLPPGPRFSLGFMVRYLRDPIGCMLPLAREYGDPVLFPGNPAVVFTGDPAGIKAIYSADPDTFEPLNQDLGIFVGARSLILLGGAEHRKARKLMTPPFHGARMRAYGAQIVRLTEQRTAAWRPGQRVSMLDTLQHISLDVILQAIFGVTEPERMASLSKLLREITNGISPLIALVPSLRREFGGVGPYASFMRRRKRLNEQVDALIAERRAAGPREDILSLLLSARYEDGQPMPDDEVRDQLVLLVLAGHETTAIAIAWSLYALHRPENAAVLERLRAELAGADSAPEGLEKLPYLEATCQETLRRYPIAPAPSPRKLLRPFELMGYALPAGMGVCAAIALAHFREEVYPEPMRFRPERFMERQFSPFEFLPFGGGSRRCLGAAMASYEMKLVLGALLRRYRLRLDSLRPDTGAVRAANAGPAHGVKMIVEEQLSL